MNLLRSTLSVEKNLVEVESQLIWGEPKTRRSKRVVAIPRSVAQLLGLHIGQYPKGDGWIFTSEAGTLLRGSDFRRRVWAPALKAAGLEGVTFHDLRHFHASDLIARGENPKAIADRLGHSSIKVTFDVYGHLMPGADAATAERLEASLT